MPNHGPILTKDGNTHAQPISDLSGFLSSIWQPRFFRPLTSNIFKPEEFQTVASSFENSDWDLSSEFHQQFNELQGKTNAISLDTPAHDEPCKDLQIDPTNPELPKSKIYENDPRRLCQSQNFPHSIWFYLAQSLIADTLSQMQELK